MPRRGDNVYQIKFNVPKKVYEAYHSLNDKAKERLRRLIMMIILASGDIESAMEFIPVNAKLELSEDTKEFIKEVVRGTKDIEELARTAGAFIATLNRIKDEMGCRAMCDMFESNSKILNKILYLYFQLFGDENEQD